MKKNLGLRSFIKMKWYLLLLAVLGCALIGALKGAAVESKRKIGITEQDLELRRQIDSGAEVSAPVFIGQIALAAEQNEFYSYKTALLGAGIGLLAGLLLLGVYYRVYELQLCKKMIDRLRPREDEEELFFRL